MRWKSDPEREDDPLPVDEGRSGMGEWPDRDEARSILESHNNDLIRKHLGADPDELSDEKYGEALEAALRREAMYAPGTFQDYDGEDHAYFVEAIKRELTFATFEDTSEILIYREGVYRANGEAAIRGWVERRYLQETGESPRNHLVNEVVQALRRRTYLPRDSFNPPGKLCLANGVLDLETLSMSPHSPDQRFTFQLPTAYDAEAACPRFLRFLEEILPEDEARKTVQMIFGCCLVPGNPLQVAFMLHGGGNNGKSTLIGALTALLGSDAISSETLQSLSMNRFAAANLWGKMANVCADIPSSPIPYTSVFKMATGGDPMRGERKFQGAFTFINDAKLIFSCNELPQVDDRTYAFWRRWVFIPFTEDFTGREDRRLSEKLKSERSGILNWAIKGLRLLNDRGAFPTGRSAKVLKEEWKRQADSLYWFIKECVRANPNQWIAKDDLYEAYAVFCDENEITKKKPEVMGKELPHHIPQVRRQRKRVGGKQVYGWAGCFLHGEELHSSNSIDSAHVGESGESSEARGPYLIETPPVRRAKRLLIEEEIHEVVRPEPRIVPRFVTPRVVKRLKTAPSPGRPTLSLAYGEVHGVVLEVIEEIRKTLKRRS